MSILRQLKDSCGIAAVVEKLPNKICLDPVSKLKSKPQKDPVLFEEMNGIPEQSSKIFIVTQNAQTPEVKFTM